MNYYNLIDVHTSANEIENNILSYLCQELKLDLFTDPQLKQLNFEANKKISIFSSADIDTDVSENGSIRRLSLKLTRSPLLQKRKSEQH